MFWFFEGTVKEMREVQLLSLFLMWKFQNFQHEVNLFAGACKHRAAVFLNSTCFFVFFFPPNEQCCFSSVFVLVVDFDSIWGEKKK